MKYLIYFATVALTLAIPVERTILNPTSSGSYRFTYATDSQARSESRLPDGTTRGAYTYVDDEDLIHEIEYVAGAEDGFKVLSHNIKGQKTNAKKKSKKNVKYNETAVDVVLIDGLTPEVAAARKSHNMYQASLRAILPELQDDEEVLPVVIRHVPGPARRLAISKSDIPAFPQRSSFETTRIEGPLRTAVFTDKNVEVPDLIPTPRNQLEYRTSTFAPFEDIPTPFPAFRSILVGEPDILEIRKIKTPKKVPAISRRFRRDVNKDDLLSVDIKLVDGFTPEVAAARKEHLRVYDITRASLPELKEIEEQQ